MAGLLACGQGPDAAQIAAFEEATHRGAAQLENQEIAESIESFERATELFPRSAPAWRNLARARLASNDSAGVAEALVQARALDSDSPATHYLSGIAFSRDGLFEEAVPHLEASVRVDPLLAVLRFQLASAYLGAARSEDASSQLHEALRLDPLHTASHYRLAALARKAGDDEELARRQSELARLRQLLGDDDRSPEALERCEYTRPELPAPAAVAAEPPPPGITFVDAGPDAGGLGPARAAAVLEVGADGRVAWVVVEPSGVLGLRTPAEEGGFTRTEIGAEAPAGEVLQIVVGNFFDDVPREEVYDPERHARNDVLVLGPSGAVLLARRLDGGFDDVTRAAGLHRLRGNRARWLDADHDGDLDLAVANAKGLQLWQNGGDGRFEEVGAAVGIELAGAVTDLAALDLRDDGAIDLIAARGDASTVVFEGLRTGQFARMPDPPGPWPPARWLRVDDVRGDGMADAVLVRDGEVAFVPGAGGEASSLPIAAGNATGAALVDYDNDGWLDLLVATAAASAKNGAGALQLFRNDRAGSWQDATQTAGLGSLDVGVVREIRAVDLDADGDSDLLLETAAGVRLLRNDGAHVAGQLKLRLQGTKTNPSGLGVRVEVRAAGLRATRAVQAIPIEIGLGGRSAVDAVQTIWTNGIIDNQIQVTPGAVPLTIVEQNVAAGSCPFLYAWDGKKHRFVTDILGNAPIGLSQERGVPLPADPDELVAVGDASQLERMDGAYVLQVTDELREAIYLDYAQLVAVDHARDVEVHATDRLGPEPFPPSELWALARRRLPKSVEGDDGISRTADVRKIDGVFAPPGALLPPPLRGKTHELVLTLDFGDIDDFEHPVLALTGWLQYGDASLNIALSQNRAAVVVPPTLEQETADGRWLPVDVTPGMPAGKTKTIVVDLAGRLEPGVTRLRLRTTFELRWDRIALFDRLPDSALAVRRLEPTAAELRERGYAEIRSREPGHPTTPVWDDLLAAPPWNTTPEGWVTAFGDVLGLMASRDDRLVVMNGGDALELRFAGALPQAGVDRLRSFFFYSVGWDKDEDHNVIGGTRVGPLPVQPEGDDDYEARHHTRFVPRDAPARSRSGL